MKRTREQARATRVALMEAAAWVFYEKGFAGATLDEIAKRAGVTRGALYGHFDNKLAMLEALFESAARPLDAFAVNLAACRNQPVENLIEEIQRCWREATDTLKTARLYALVFNLSASTLESAPFFACVVAAYRDSEMRIEEWLRRAMTQACLPATFDTQRAARVIHATLNGLLRRRLMNLSESNLRDADVAKIMRALVQQGSVQADPACLA